MCTWCICVPVSTRVRPPCVVGHSNSMTDSPPRQRNEQGGNGCARAQPHLCVGPLVCAHPGQVSQEEDRLVCPPEPLQAGRHGCVGGWCCLRCFAMPDNALAYMQAGQSPAPPKPLTPCPQPPTLNSVSSWSCTNPASACRSWNVYCCCSCCSGPSGGCSREGRACTSGAWGEVARAEAARAHKSSLRCVPENRGVYAGLGASSLYLSVGGAGGSRSCELRSAARGKLGARTARTRQAP